MSEQKKIRPLYERKQAFAERQAARQRGVFSGAVVQGTGPANAHGMPKVPVDQRVVRNWPVLDLGDVPGIDEGNWKLEVTGLVRSARTFTYQELLGLPQTEDISDFHCVTGWSRLDNRWNGVRLVDLADAVGASESARFLLMEGYDYAPGTNIPYTTSISMEEAMQPDVMLVHTWEGAPLPLEHGGPVRVITPQLYAWKGAKWIKKLTFAERDTLGFWEVRGYSNTALPWYNDRYSR